MYAQQEANTKRSAMLRKEAGLYLQSTRATAGLTQLELARLVGVKEKGFISQLENGVGRVPPNSYDAWARAVNVPVSEFVKHLMRCYDPMTFAAIFGGGSQSIDEEQNV